MQYYEDPKKTKELEAKIQEYDKNANSAENDTECANAYKAQKSLWKKLENNLRNKISFSNSRSKYRTNC